MKRVFAIEDNDTNYYLLEEILSEYNVEMVRAADGKEFYNIMQKNR
ncbi:MAG TPA: hypothetical protein PK252_00750 [Bacteroidales bacterium]|mgnify:FL=1|nr:hypothetical protein [Bacteroidales bacterium]